MFNELHAKLLHLRSPEVTDRDEQEALLEEIESIASGLDRKGRPYIDSILTLSAQYVRMEGAAAAIGPILDPLIRLVGAEAQEASPGPGTTRVDRDSGSDDTEAAQDIGIIQDLLLGEIMKRFHLVEENALSAALRLSSKSDRLLGDVLVEMGAASEEDVRAALQYQRQRLGVELPQPRPEETRPEETRPEETRPEETLGEIVEDGGWTKIAPAKPAAQHADLKLISELMLGRILVLHGRVDEEQLEEALLVHRATDLPLGEALVQIGATDMYSVADGAEDAALPARRLLVVLGGCQPELRFVCETSCVRGVRAYW